MGGSVTIQFAISYPGMLDGLALIDTTAWYGADAPKSWHERGQKAVTDGLASMIAFQQTRWFSDGFRDRQSRRSPSTSPTCFSRAICRRTRRRATCSARSICAPMSAAIAVPTEILVGEEDYATPPDMARALHAAIPGSNLTIVPGARHLTPIEIPDRIAAIIRSVIAQQRKAAALQTGGNFDGRGSARPRVRVHQRSVQCSRHAFRAAAISRISATSKYGAKLTNRVGPISLTFDVVVELTKVEAPSAIDAIGERQRAPADVSRQRRRCGSQRSTASIPRSRIRSTSV